MVANAFGRVWEKIVKVAFTAFIVLYIVSSVHLFIEKSNLIPNWGMSWITSVVVAIILGLCLNWFWDRFFLEKEINIKHPVLVLAFIPLVIKCTLIFVFPISVDLGDISCYTRISYELVSNGIVNSHRLYAAQYPHLFNFALFLAPASIVGNGQYYCYEIYIATIQCLTNLCVFYSMRKLEQSDFVAILYAYMPSQIILCLCVTHENAFLFFLSLILLIYCYGIKDRENVYVKSACLFAVAILVGIAARVNSMGLVLIIALCICLVSVLNKQNCLWILFFVIMILSFNQVISQLDSKFQYQVCGQEYYPTGKAFYSNIYIGANVESEGRYEKEHEQNVDTLIKQQLGNDYTLDQYYDVMLEYAKKDWIDLFKHPMTLARHTVNKFGNVWSGTHYSIEQLNNVTDYQSRTKSIACYLLMIVNNLLWIYLLIKTLMKMWDNREEEWSMGVVFAMTLVLGVMSVLLIAEVMNKYSLSAMLALVYIIGGQLTYAET